MTIFAKMRTVVKEFEGQSLTWRRSGLKSSLRGETLVAELQEAISGPDKPGNDVIEVLFVDLLKIVKEHLLLIDGEPVTATVEEMAEELNYAMIMRLWEHWHTASKPTEIEKNVSPQP